MYDNVIESDIDEEVNEVEYKLSYVGSDDEDDEQDGDANYVPEDYHWEPIKYIIMRRTIETICDLICSFPNATTFVPDKSDCKNENWIESLVGFYIFGTIASDWHLIVDSEIWTNISNAFRVMLDGFQKDLWQTVVENNIKTTDSVSMDIVEALNFIGRFEDASNLFPWDPEDLHFSKYTYIILNSLSTTAAQI